MKALILSAGLGTRLRPLTEKMPKPLLPVGGKPLLLRHLERLALFGVDSVLINTHYLAEQVGDFVEEQKNKFPGILIATAYEQTLLGSAGTLKSNETFFSDADNFLIVYGDNLTNIDYAKLLEEHNKKKGLVTIACYYEPHPESKGIINFNDEGKISSFVEKPKKEQITSNWANAGIYVVNKEIFSYLQEFHQIPLDFGHHVFPHLLEAGEGLYVYKMSEKVLDIGTMESYNEAQHLVKNLFNND